MTYVFPKRLIKGSQLTNAAVGYYSAPSGAQTIIRKVSLTNTSANTVTVDAWLVPVGASATDQYQVVKSATIQPGMTIEPTALNGVLDTGGSIQAKCSAGASVTIMAHGMECYSA